MGFFSAIANAVGGKKKVREFKQDLSRIENKDLFEAIVAGGLYMAYLDGKAGEDEIAKLNALLNSNDKLEAFSTYIPETMSKWRKRLDADLMVGRQDVEKEIMDMRDDREGSKAVILNMLSVAGSDGTVDDKEEKALRRFADMLGVDISPYIEQ